MHESYHLLLDQAYCAVIFEGVQKRRSPDVRRVLFGQSDAHVVGKLVNLVRVLLAQLIDVIVAILVLYEDGSILQDELHKLIVNFEAFLNSGVVEMRKWFVNHLYRRFPLRAIDSDGRCATIEMMSIERGLKPRVVTVLFFVKSLHGFE
jgi:hypothetical protein